MANSYVKKKRLSWPCDPMVCVSELTVPHQCALSAADLTGAGCPNMVSAIALAIGAAADAPWSPCSTSMLAATDGESLGAKAMNHA